MSHTPWDGFIDFDRVKSLYKEGIRRHGGQEGPPRDGCVEGSLGGAWSAEQYQEPSPGMVEGFVFAGFLLYYLAKNHCFPDGNKRAAWMAATDVLLSIGASLDATDDDAEQMVVAVAKGEISSGTEVVQWLAERLIPIPPEIP